MVFRRYEERPSGLLAVHDLGMTVVHFVTGFQASGLLATPNSMEIRLYGQSHDGQDARRDDPADDSLHETLATMRQDSILTWENALQGVSNAAGTHHHLMTIARQVDDYSPGGIILPNTGRIEFVGNVATPDEVDTIERITNHVGDFVTRNTGEVPGNYL